jgi:hypothetical protein
LPAGSADFKATTAPARKYPILFAFSEARSRTWVSQESAPSLGPEEGAT